MANQKNIDKHKFKKGQSGNPNGRKPGKSISTILKELLEKVSPKEFQSSKVFTAFLKKNGFTNKEAMAAVLLYKALVKHNDKSIEQILDRTEGKVTQPIDQNISGELNTHVPLFPDVISPKDGKK